MNERKIIHAKVCPFHESYVSIFEGNSIQETINTLENIKLQYAGRDVYFQIDYYGHDGGTELSLWEHREENDTEYNERMKQEKRKADSLKKTEEKELAEYKRLQQKFQGKA